MVEKYIPFIILASVFVLFNLYILIKKILFLKQAISAVGIVKIAGAGSLSDGADGAYFQTVEFQTEKGEIITIHPTMGGSSDRGTKGAAVEVLYLKESPKDGVIKDFKNIWGFESIAFLIGLGGLFVYFKEI